MSTIMDDAFKDDTPEVESSQRIARLQGIVCYLLGRNEELRAAVRELKHVRLQNVGQEDE
jgi:hypothetical protein